VNERRAAVATINGRASRRFALDQSIRYRYSAPVTNLRQRLWSDGAEHDWRERAQLSSCAHPAAHKYPESLGVTYRNVFSQFSMDIRASLQVREPGFLA
jgi:hypothetical protein